MPVCTQSHQRLKTGGPVATEGGGEVQNGKEGLLKSVDRTVESPGVLSHSQPVDCTSMKPEGFPQKTLIRQDRASRTTDMVWKAEKKRRGLDECLQSEC